MVPADTLESQIDRLSQDIHRLMLFHRKRLTDILTAHDLTLPQYLTLLALQRDEPGSRMGDLAQKLHASSATMTGVVDRLEEAGLVERVLDRSDRRAIQVRVTERALHLVEGVARDHREHLGRALGKLGPDDREQLARLIHVYLAALEAREQTE